MKKGPKVKYDQHGSGNYDFQCDHAEDPGDVLETVNTRLKDFGLEVLSHESDSDYFAFSIRKIKKPAVKKVVQHPLTVLSLEKMAEAIKNFGEYTFGDKGPNEVMDVSSLVTKYKGLPAPVAAKALKELYDCKSKKGDPQLLVSSIICEMQDWEELFKQPELDEIDW